ncbi:MAG: ATP-binding protein [Anaerolineae bacterium]
MQLQSHKTIDDHTKTEWLTTILNTTTEGFIILDLDGSVKMSNQPADQFLANMMGKDPDSGIFDTQHAVSVIGYKPVELVKLLTNIRVGKMPENNKKVIPIERENEVQYLERQESIMRDKDGEINGLMIVFRDITEQIEREKWRDEFTNMVVHDLKNPVSTLYTSFEWMAPIIQNPDAAMLVDSGRRVSQQLLDMIDSLMDMARMEAGRLSADPEGLNLVSIAQHEVDILMRTAKRKKISLSLQAHPELEPVWADRSMVRRIFSNLIDNALKFTPSNGNISIEINPTDPRDGLFGGSKVVISDTGKGIPIEDRTRIFSRFEMVGGRGKSHRGTGIGLSFCKQALEAMGGRIWIEDNTEQGSRFIFVLPGIPVFNDVESGEQSQDEFEKVTHIVF